MNRIDPKEIVAALVAETRACAIRDGITDSTGEYAYLCGALQFHLVDALRAAPAHAAELAGRLAAAEASKPPADPPV